MEYNLTRKYAYLKSEIGEIGHFWTILGFLQDFDALAGGRGLWIRHLSFTFPPLDGAIYILSKITEYFNRLILFTEIDCSHPLFI